LPQEGISQILSVVYERALRLNTIEARKAVKERLVCFGHSRQCLRATGNFNRKVSAAQSP
jgi:hypothetical protein